MKQCFSKGCRHSNSFLTDQTSEVWGGDEIGVAKVSLGNFRVVSGNGNKAIKVASKPLKNHFEESWKSI